ncbi:MAG TPA: alkaline phosphatase family protein [Acidobacteriaceae bacterium]|jgi:predicted AlkP superfamily pyrophosphatase or phosphodiesterase|nr:alkaline phosphatase family protein [Acidobacteriaceae bacterium]
MTRLRLPLLLCALVAASLVSAQTAPPDRKPDATHTRRAPERHEVPLPPPPSAYNDHPKLAIILVIDQFRGDYLDRWRADFKDRGFDLFLDHGAYFPECYYDYANTKTAPGHAAIGTGAYTDGNGIASNSWWDLSRNQQRPVTSVEDERYRMVGVPAGSMPPNVKYMTGSSPRNLLASTVGDELRLATQGQAKVFGVSLKDRAAILPAGAAANGAFWIDPASGDFVTSSFYMPQLPDWATAFNSSGAIAQAEQDAGLSTVTNFYEQVGSTPAANAYELQFAEALIQGEHLGQDNVTDLLTLSLSANDILGHAKGPDSPDEEHMVDSLDTQLDGFFTWLDKNIPGGLGNVWIALTADHGVAPIPATAAQYGLNAATIDMKKLVAALNYAINMKFSPGEKVEYILPHQDLPYISLNQSEFLKAGIIEQEAELAVQQLLPGAFASLEPSAPEPPPSDTPVAANPPANQPTLQPSDTRLPPRPVLVRSYTREQLADGPLPPTPWGQLIAHSYSPNGGWYVMVIPEAYQMAVAQGTTHFSPYSYDRHVPLGFYGAPFAPGTYNNFVQPVDLAATFAALLRINQPSASVGHILTEALKPAADVVYPKPPPPPRLRHTVTHHSTETQPKAAPRPKTTTRPKAAPPQ